MLVSAVPSSGQRPQLELGQQHGPPREDEQGIRMLRLISVLHLAKMQNLLENIFGPQCRVMANGVMRLVEVT